MTSLRRVLVLVLLEVAAPVIGTAQTLSFTEFTPDPRHIDVDSASAQSIAGLGELLKATLGTAFPTTYQPEKERVYVVVHVLRWGDPTSSLPAQKDNHSTTPNSDVRPPQAQNNAAPQPVQQVQHSRWYVYSNDGGWSLDDFQKNNRVFGVSRLWLAAVHLNVYAEDEARLAEYRAKYTVKVVGKQPIALQRFAELASLVIPATDSAKRARLAIAAREDRSALWGATQIAVPNPSDITITPFLEVADDASKQDVPLGDETKFDNEGRTLIDFGIAVPIRSATELEAGEGGDTAVPKVVSKSNAFATFDLYFRPVDVKGGGLKRAPHAVAGLSVTKKPLHNFFLGLGWGPAIANFFGAYQWTKLEEPASDGKWDGRVIFGVELPLTATLISKLK